MERHVRQTQSAENVFAALPAFNGCFARMMPWPIEARLHLQSEMLSAAAPAAAQWIDRRREGAISALASIERPTKCTDVRDASEIQNEWVKDETERLEADVRSLDEQALLFVRTAEKASRRGVPAAGAE